MSNRRRTLDGFRYKAFISYSHRDEETARRLHRALETYRPPSGVTGPGGSRYPLRPVFRDEEELTAAANLSDSLISALRQSEYLIVICSPAAVESRWIAQEIIEFKRYHGDDRVIAVIAEGDAPDCFPPPLLQDIQSSGEPGAVSLEPLAAEYRGNRARQRLALLKVAATMLGVDLDRLVQRDAQRRHRILAGVAVAALAGMLIMSGLTYTAVVERRAADMARLAAEQARQVAETRRRESEDLVEFMLSDLRRRLEPVGRLDVLDAVGAKVLEYYAAQEETGISPDALGRRARALHLLGEIEDIKGDSGRALALFEQAAKTTRMLLAAEPDDQQRVFEHAQSHYWVGSMAWAQGDLERAHSSFQSYLDMSERLVALSPENRDWQLEVNYALVALGAVYFEQGAWGEAVAAFTRAVDVLETLAQQAPASEQYLADLANTYSWLTSALIEEKSYGAALRTVQRETAAWERHLAADPRDFVGLRQSLVARRAEIELLLIAGDVARAAEELIAAEALVERLVEHEPDSTLNREQALHVSKTRARLALALGNLRQAREHTGHCLEQAARLRELDEAKQFWTLEFELPCALLATETEHRDKRTAEALRLVEPVYAELARLWQAEGGSASEDLRRLWGEANLLYGDIVYTQGAPSRAEAFWVTARDALNGPAVELSAERLIALAAALNRLGMDTRARELVDELSRLGYRYPGTTQRLAEPG